MEKSVESSQISNDKDFDHDADHLVNESEFQGRLKNSVTTNIENASSLASKPIKKTAAKVIFDDDESLSDSDRRLNNTADKTCGQGTQKHLKGSGFNDRSSVVEELDDAHTVARAELLSFLTRKGIDTKLADSYTVHVKKTRNHGSSKSNQVSQGSGSRELQGVSITYSSPDGGFLASKNDVLNDIKNERRRFSDVSMISHANNPIRVEAHSKARVDVLETTLPVTMGHITLLQLGRVDLRSGFHSPVQIFPVGYKCEQIVNGTTIYKGPMSQKIVCEIEDLDGYPQFRITVNSTGDTYMASKESEVWKKFNPNNIELDWNPSFFSLRTEILIEGLDGALACEGYKFHAERGYGTNYITADEARKAKADFLKTWERERRTQDRQKNATMSKEEKQKNAEMNNKKMAEEKELNKKLSALEKERKEKERDEVRKRKELQKQEDAKRREQLRLQQQEVQKREKASVSKGSKDSSKQRQQIRRDVNSDIRKNRTDASSTVLQFYDYEELEELASSSLSRSTQRLSIEGDVGNDNLLPSLLADFCSSLPNFAIIDPTVPDSGDKGSVSVDEAKADMDAVEKTIFVSTTLNLLHNHLNLETSSKLDSIIACLKNIYPPGSKEEQQQQQQQQQPVEKMSPGESAEDFTPESADMSVKGNENLEKSTEEEEEEWNESTSPKRTSKSGTAVPSRQLIPDVFSAKSLADLDRIQLKIVKALTHELHAALDLTVTDDAEKAAQKLRLPLNQLTWMEIARMRVLCQVYTELGRNKDDIQHAIRGSKSTSFKTAKNVARNIRYRLAIKTSGAAPTAAPTAVSHVLFEETVANSRYPDDLLARMQCAIASKTIAEPDSDKSQMLATNVWDDSVKVWTPSPQLNKFMSEQDIMAALHTAAVNAEDYSEEYRRACKVLMKILGLSLAKNFIWEVNSVSDPEYYRTISNPIFLVHVASKLVDKLYNENESISVQFYEDMRNVAVNCITYFSEFYSIVAQAQKLVAAVYRHVERWMALPQSADDGEQVFPTVDQCDEKYCLLSFVQMERGSPLKCGKCLGLYSCESVYKYSNSQSNILPAIYPAIEIVEQVSEEWICPLCLREDSCTLVPVLVGAEVSSSKSKPLAFYVDEWGPSASIPWLLNTTYSRELPLLEGNNPSISNYVAMLKVLADPSCSSIPRQAIGNAANTSNKLSKIISKLQINLSHLGPRDWTISERLSVLSGLCTLLRCDPFIITVIEHLYSECDRLIKLFSKPNFREADFISSVRELCGEEVVSMCRGLLDGLAVDGTQNPQEASAAYLQNQITQGRCIVCNGSTFEDDTDDVADEILLCDGCNAEAHLKCLNLTAVPSSDWHCYICKERIQQRESLNDNQFEDIDSQRFKELETALLNDLVEGSTIKLDGTKCSLCGLGESELCSPLVVAQSRAEHDAALETHSQINDRAPLCKLSGRILNAIKGYSGNSSVQSVELKFTLRGKPIGPSVLSYPFFPPINSFDGNKLMELYSEMGQSPVIAHQLCALQLFQARMNRNRHTLRRRRKVVGDRVVSYVGISTKPLGIDRNGSEYWKLPTCDDLLILFKASSQASSQHPPTNMEDGYLRYIAGGGQSSKTWKRISNTRDIQRLAELLDDASELNLKMNIVNLFLLEQPPPAAQPQDAEEDAANDNQMIVQGKDDEEEELDDSGEAAAAAEERSEENPLESKVDNKKKSSIKDSDNFPVALMLRTDKGPDISKYYVIEQENAFEDEADVETGENEDDEHRSFEYFTFGKGKSRYFAVAIVNAAGKTVKVMPKMGLTIVYQIHREGISTPLQHVPLRESWSDNIYYFSTIKFKKSGRYTISFLVERANGAGFTGTIKPLIYPVVVQAERIRCGVADALDKLNASKYVDQNVSTGRAVQTERLEALAVINQLRSDEMSEVDAVKCALLMVYAALPAGALSSQSAGKSGMTLSDSFVNQIAEPQDWTDALDQAWRGAVFEAACAKSLMEMTLLLEFYINKTWIGSPQHRLLQVLPNPHFAIRCATLSAVSLRIYCMDKALLYEKVQSAPRERRSSSGGGKAVEIKQVPNNSSSRSKPRQRFDSGNQDSEAWPSRQKRSAAAAASAKIRNLNGDQDSGDDDKRGDEDEPEDEDDDDDDKDEDDEDDGRGGRSANGTSKRLAAKMAAVQAEVRISSTHWICSDCSTQNETRARSCDGCGARKPAAPSTIAYGSSRSARSSGADAARRRVAAAPVQSRRMAHRSIAASDDEDDDEDEEKDGEQANERNGELDARSPRKRRSTSVSYFEDIDDEEVEEEERKKKRQKPLVEEEEDFPDTYAQQLLAYEKELPGKLQDLSDFIRNMASSRASDDDAIDMNLRIISLLRWLLSDIQTEPFWTPVDLSLYPDYSSIVQTPMDLGTILSRAKKCSYSEQYEFFRDVLQVWANCKKYNAPDSLLFSIAERLETEFRDKFDSWIEDDDKPVDPDISYQ